MARKMRGKTRYFRLDRRERKAIEHALGERRSCRSIAADLGRSPSTVHDEAVRNRVVTRGPGKGDNVTGTDGAQAGDARVCPLLLEWPFCCNGCKYLGYGRSCSMRWRCEYRAADAEAFAEEDLVGPRRGVSMEPERFERAIFVIRADLERGLSPRQIANARAEEVGVSPSTIYRWIDEGYGGMSNLELRRKVGYKPRKGPRARRAPPPTARGARTRRSWPSPRPSARPPARWTPWSAGPPTPSAC